MASGSVGQPGRHTERADALERLRLEFDGMEGSYTGDLVHAVLAEIDFLAAALREAEEALANAREAGSRAVYLAEHLFQMVDPQTWRDSGGDDGQGHYEGDYHAEHTRLELNALGLALRASTGRTGE